MMSKCQSVADSSSVKPAYINSKSRNHKSDCENSARCVNLVKNGYRSGSEAGELLSDVKDTDLPSAEPVSCELSP